jgi:hypothetical protein
MTHINPPTTPDIANLKYSKKTQALIDDMTAKRLDWAQEDTKLAELEDNVTDAKHKDAMALQAAAIANEPDPGTENTEAAERAILYQVERVRHSRSNAQKAGSLVSKALHTNRIAIIDEAVKNAEVGIEIWKKEVSLIQSNYELLVKARHESLEGLRMLSNLGMTTDLVQFDPGFPVSGNLVVPQVREDRILGLLTLLTKMFHPADTEKPEALHAKLGTAEALSEPALH